MLKLLAVVEGANEQAYHRQFAYPRRGEYFEPVPELLKLILQHCKPKLSMAA